MKYEDRQDIIITIINYDKILKQAEELAEQVGRVHGYYDRWKLDEVEVDTAEIKATFWASVRGEVDYGNINFPLSYLWDENWEEKEKESIRKWREAEDERKKEKEQQRLIDQEQKERAQLVRLKEKYEEDNG